MDMFLQLSLLKFFLVFYFLFISRFGKQQQMNSTFWKTWRTAEMVDKGLDVCTNTEEHLELSSVWRRLGPVSKRCQTLEVGGSSGASSLHSRARAWDRMPCDQPCPAHTRKASREMKGKKEDEGEGDKRTTALDWGLRTGTSCLAQADKLFCSNSQIRWDSRNQRWITIILKSRNTSTVTPDRENSKAWKWLWLQSTGEAGGLVHSFTFRILYRSASTLWSIIISNVAYPIFSIFWQILNLMFF